MLQTLTKNSITYIACRCSRFSRNNSTSTDKLFNMNKSFLYPTIYNFYAPRFTYIYHSFTLVYALPHSIIGL